MADALCGIRVGQEMEIALSDKSSRSPPGKQRMYAWFFILNYIFSSLGLACAELTFASDLIWISPWLRVKRIELPMLRSILPKMKILPPLLLVLMLLAS